MIHEITHVMQIVSSVVLLIWCALFVAATPQFPRARDRAIILALAALAFIGGIA